MMTNTTYKTGQIPKKGDIVRLMKNSELSYYSMVVAETRKNSNTTFVVENVMNGSTSTLVRLVGIKADYKASHFELIKESTYDNDSKTPVRFRIVSSDGQFIANARDLTRLKTVLENLLVKYPGKEFDVYQYMNTAKAKVPVVEFVDKSQRVNEVLPQHNESTLFSENNEKMFTKL